MRLDQWKTVCSTLLLVVCFLMSTLIGFAQSPKKLGLTARADYKRDVLPLLKAHCYQCHSGDQQQGGLRLDTKRFAMKGGISGLTIVTGKGDQSSLVQRMRGQGILQRMPLGFTPLSESEGYT